VTVRSVYTVKSRGTVLSIVIDDVIPALGDRVRRKSDQQTAMVRGIERHRVNRDLMSGDVVGLLVDGGEWAEGDDVEVEQP
jgi:translation elongation factor EF-Tu-like GTPase